MCESISRTKITKSHSVLSSGQDKQTVLPYTLFGSGLYFDNFRVRGMDLHGTVIQQEEACTTERPTVRADRTGQVQRVAVTVVRHTVAPPDR